LRVRVQGQLPRPPETRKGGGRAEFNLEAMPGPSVVSWICQAPLIEIADQADDFIGALRLNSRPANLRGFRSDSHSYLEGAQPRRF
jgi:hypothetical protein